MCKRAIAIATLARRNVHSQLPNNEQLRVTRPYRAADRTGAAPSLLGSSQATLPARTLQVRRQICSRPPRWTC